MRSPKLVFVLLATALIALAATLALGLRALYADVESARTRYVERAASAARTAATAIEAVQAETAAERADALELAADGEGSLAAPDPRARVAQAGSRELRTLLEREVDALEREGRLDEARERLKAVAQRDDQPELAAWALTGLAARALQEHRVDDARAAWTAIVERFPTARDDQGLLRASAARLGLAEIAGWPVAELERLFDDLEQDRASLHETATAALTERVLDRLRSLAPDSARIRDATHARHVRELRLRASWTSGISNWLAQDAPGGAQVFDLASDPLAPPHPMQRILVVSQRDSDGWRCSALELDALAAQALARPEMATWSELGFACAIEGANGAVLAGTPPAAGAPFALERAAPPLSELSVRAHGRDFEGFAAGERRRFQLVALLAVGALCAGMVAAAATVRAVRREASSAREREGFVAAVTHELKTPLASIRLFAELLERGDVEPAKVREFGARTVDETDRLARLVDGVLHFARLERGGGNGRARERVELQRVAELALASIAPLARRRGFELELRAPPEPVAALGDRDALVGALVELIENATKYGGAPHAIEVRIESDASHARVAVLDRGPGIPEAERERIFEPFHRLGDELTRERTGVGLGLALVRGVAQSHGGRVTYAAREGGGSRFELELPRV